MHGVAGRWREHGRRYGDELDGSGRGAELLARVLQRAGRRRNDEEGCPARREGAARAAGVPRWALLDPERPAGCVVRPAQDAELAGRDSFGSVPPPPVRGEGRGEGRELEMARSPLPMRFY